MYNKENFLSNGVKSVVDETIIKFYHRRAVPDGKGKYNFTCLHGHEHLGLDASEVMTADINCKQCANNEVNTKEFYIKAIKEAQGERRFDIRTMGDISKCDQKVDVVCPRHGLVALPITNLISTGTVAKLEPCEFCAMSNLHVAVAVVHTKDEYLITLTDSYPALQSFAVGNGKNVTMIKAGAESVVTQNYRTVVGLLGAQGIPLKGKAPVATVIQSVTSMYKAVAYEHSRQADLAFGELEYVMALKHIETLPEFKSTK